MDYAEITTLIGSIGFPAVMCVMLYKQMVEQTEAITNLKVAIQHLSDMITRGGEPYDNPNEAGHDDDQ